MSDNIEAELQKFEELESQLAEVEVKSDDEEAVEEAVEEATEEAPAEEAEEEAPAEEEAEESEDGEESDEVVEEADSEDEAEVEEEEDSSDNHEGEEKSVDPEMSAKAMSIMQQISEEESESDMPVLFLSDIRYKEMKKTTEKVTGLDIAVEVL